MRVLKLWIGIPAQLLSMSSHQQVSTAVPLTIIQPGSIDKERCNPQLPWNLHSHQGLRKALNLIHIEIKEMMGVKAQTCNLSAHL